MVLGSIFAEGCVTLIFSNCNFSVKLQSNGAKEGVKCTGPLTAFSLTPAHASGRHAGSGLCSVVALSQPMSAARLPGML